ncbi:MAG: PEP-CTERM sorting domain-containing protein [Thermoguttaceae bacterium]
MMKTFALSLVLVGLMATMASANLVLSLQAEGYGSSTNISLSVGSSTAIVFDVYAKIYESDGVTLASATTSSLTDAYMRFTSVEGTAGLMGNMSTPTLGATWSALGGLGTEQNYDGNADWEWGGAAPPTNTPGGYYYAATLTPPAGNSFLLGTITWTPTTATAGGVDTIQVVPYIRNSNSTGYDSYALDGTTWTNQNVNNNPGGISSGTALTLTVVPEPATLILLGMGVLSLLFFRRRK